MSLRLKIILGVLVAIAGFMILRVAFVFNKDIDVANTNATILNALNKPSVPEDPMTIDSDHDGLPDRDEVIYGTDPFNPDTDGDGFKDGEEVAGGHDPLDASDTSTSSKDTVGISAMSPTANLTDRLLNLGVANLLNSSGDLDPEQMTDKKYADILQDVTTSALLTLAGPPITDETIKISNDNSPENIKKYINTISNIVEEGLLSPSAKTLTGSSDLLGFSSDPNYYNNKYNSLLAIEVPSSWKEIHKATLKNLLILSNTTKSLVDGAINEDPIMASFALDQLQNAFLALNGLLSEAAKLAKTQNISIQDSILETMSAANKTEGQ